MKLKLKRKSLFKKHKVHRGDLLVIHKGKLIFKDKFRPAEGSDNGHFYISEDDGESGNYITGNSFNGIIVEHTAGEDIPKGELVYISNDQAHI